MYSDVWITEDDLGAIRKAILAWGKSASIAEKFHGADLPRYYEAWQIFVETDWSDWDISEYNHDIGMRYWIQLSIEHSCPETQTRLQNAVNPIDAVFQSKMRPCKSWSFAAILPLAHSPYFWETNTLHPDAL